MTAKEKLLNFLEQIGAGKFTVSAVNLRDVEGGVFGGLVIDFQAAADEVTLLVEGKNGAAYFISVNLSKIERLETAAPATNNGNDSDTEIEPSEGNDKPADDGGKFPKIGTLENHNFAQDTPNR